MKQKMKKMRNEQRYIIDGKFYGVFPMIFASAVSIVFLALAVDQLRGGNGKIFVVGLMFLVGFILSLFVSIPLINRYFFFKVCVRENDFYIRTTPFNEKTYRYSEVKSAKTELKTSMRRGSVVYVYYFYFTDGDGKEHKFQFDKAVHEKEISALKNRINEKNLTQ